MDRDADLKLALRVLSAIVEKREPDPKDVKGLRNIAPANAGTWPLDEMACEVIKQARKRRARAVGKSVMSVD
jgi:hypothetical protein